MCVSVPAIDSSPRRSIVLLANKLKLHIAPMVLSAILIIAAAWWQYSDSVRAGRAVSGSSLSGLCIGSLAAAIIFFELLLWPRKRLRRWKLGRTKTWLAYHLWLGLATGPLAWIHAGYRFGGTFATVLMCLLLFVLASGLYGWVMQVVIPRWMLGNLPQETILSQIDDVATQNALEARQMLTVALGTDPTPSVKRLVDLNEAASRFSGTSTQRNAAGQMEAIVVGARQRRDPQRSLFDKDVDGDFSPSDRAEIWKQYGAVIEPFLLRGIPSLAAPPGFSPQNHHSPIQTMQKTMDWFSMLRDACSPNAKPILDRLQSIVEQRHQWDTQRRVHALLHGWIAIHAGVSIMLGVLLLAHIVLALRYM